MDKEDEVHKVLLMMAVVFQVNKKGEGHQVPLMMSVIFQVDEVDGVHRDLATLQVGKMGKMRKAPFRGKT